MGIRERPPMDRWGVTHKVTLYGPQQQSDGPHAAGQAQAAVDFYVTLNRYPDGRPCEVFVRTGGGHQGWCDAIGRLVSLLLQHGVPMGAVCRQLEFAHFAPFGMVPGFGFARSFTDYLARWMKSQ